MKFKIPLKNGDIVYTIEECKIEKYFVEGFELKENISISDDISNDIIVKLERYNDGTNSYKINLRLSKCFLNKKELIEQLEKM